MVYLTTTQEVDIYYYCPSFKDEGIRGLERLRDLLKVTEPYMAKAGPNLSPTVLFTSVGS